jgi:hypothetical protein
MRLSTFSVPLRRDLNKNLISAQRLPGLALEIFQVTVIKPFTPQPLVLRFCVPMAECRRTFESLPCEIYVIHRKERMLFYFLN